MKVKKIRIRPKEQFWSELHEVARALDRGEALKRYAPGVFFDSLDAVRKVLTDKRLELWRTIRDRKPGSISALAKMVGRGFRPVHRDLMLLQYFGLIRLGKTKGKRGDLQCPVSLADELQVAVA